MRRSFILFSLLLCVWAPVTSLFAGGGPDTYGYTWLETGEPGGPAYSWIDITGTGTLVSGLADDNTVGPIGIGFNFHYYWNDYDRIKLGSNGWFSFDISAGNVAHCFPPIPDVGGNADDMVAPYLTDLNFAGAANPGEVYYYTNNADTFILSFINVPWWVSGIPDYTGSNTFQVILSGADSSITFQYKDVDPAAFDDIVGCDQDLVIGIENVTGDMGLQHSSETVPPDSHAIKFYYPDSVLTTVQDNTPSWNQNTDNKGEFVLAGTFDVRANIKNVGSADITSPTYVEAEIRNLGTTPVYASLDTIPGLMAGASSLVNFSPSATITTAGQYYYDVRVSNVDDINPANDNNITELSIVDLSGGTAQLTWCTNNPPDGSIRWTGGGSGNDGVAVYQRPPFYPVNINSIDMFIRQVAFSPANNSGYTVQIWDDDGPGGTPGTILDSVVVATGSYTPESWVNTPLTAPLRIDTGGYYIAWRMGGDSAAIGTEAFGPISRRSYEILSNTFAEYRENTEERFLIIANVALVTCAPSASFTYSDVAFSVSFTNSSAGATSYLWDFGDGDTSTAVNPTHLYTVSGEYEVCLIASDSCGTDTLCEFIDVCPLPESNYAAVSAGDSTYDFTDLSVGTGVTLLWDFGDGDTSSATNPSHTFPGPGSYNVCLYATSVCGSDTFCDSIFIAGAGLMEWEEDQISIYPNPTEGKIYLQWKDPLPGTYDLEIMDLNGRVIWSEELNWKGVEPYAIDLSGRSSGIYFLRMKGEKGIMNRKVVLR